MLFRRTNLPAVYQLGSFPVIKGVVKAVIRPLDMQIGIVGDDVQFFGIIQSFCLLLRHRAIFQFALNLKALFIGSKENDLRRQHFGILSRKIFLDVGGFIVTHLMEIADQPVFRLPGGCFCWLNLCFCRCRFWCCFILLFLRRGYVDALFLANLPIMPETAIEEAVAAVLASRGLPMEAVEQAASIDLKAGEAGLLSYCEQKKIPIRFYTAEELGAVPGEFTTSAFVSSVTGVDNVCERAAARNGDPLIVRKTACRGVTVAVSRKKWEVTF